MVNDKLVVFKERIRKLIHYGVIDSYNAPYVIYELAYLKKYIDTCNYNFLQSSDCDLNSILINLSNNKDKLISDVAKDLFSSFKLSKDTKPIIEFILDLNEDGIREIMKTDFSNYDSKLSLFTTPYEIVDLVNRLYSIDTASNVLDACSGMGNYLVDTSKKYDANSFTGIEINGRLALISKLRLNVLNNDKNNIINDDFLTYNDKNKYDRIFSNYPIGIRVDSVKTGYIENSNNLRFKWEYKNSSSADWMFINKIISLLTKDGKAFTLMASGPLFKTADNIYKKDLLDNGMIEKIIKLPEKLFTGTSLSFNLIILSENNKKVQFVDGSSAYLKTNGFCNILDVEKLLDIINGNSNLTNRVDNKKIADNDYLLTVDNYIGIKEIKYHNPVKLSNYILDIFRGYQLNADEKKKISNPTGEYEILMISDIDDGIINNDLLRVNSNDGKMDRYLLQNGDLIISSRGTRIKIAVAEIGKRKVVANGNLIVVRLDLKKINPYYLAMYLSSNEGNSILKSIQTGAVIISINPSKLSNIMISSVDLEKQNKYASLYWSKIKQVSLAKKHLNNLQSEVSSFYENFSEEMFK